MIIRIGGFDMARHIFISYSKKDSEFALKLADDLVNTGHKVWIDRSLQVGEDWEETIEKKQFKHCGEPCAAVCKKMNGIYKKDYEPYQALGPNSGIFDQRAHSGYFSSIEEVGIPNEIFSKIQ